MGYEIYEINSFSDVPDSVCYTTGEEISASKVFEESSAGNVKRVKVELDCVEDSSDLEQVQKRCE